MFKNKVFTHKWSKITKNSRNASSTVMCHTMEPSIYNSLHLERVINFSPYGEKDICRQMEGHMQNDIHSGGKYRMTDINNNRLIYSSIHHSTVFTLSSLMYCGRPL